MPIYLINDGRPPFRLVPISRLSGIGVKIEIGIEIESIQRRRVILISSWRIRFDFDCDIDIDSDFECDSLLSYLVTAYLLSLGLNT